MFAAMTRFLLTAFLFVIVATTSATAAEKLTISLWGGGYGESWKKTIVDPFVAQTGIEVTMDFGGSSQRLAKLLATKGGPDIILLTDHQMAIAKDRGLIDPVDPKNVPNLSQLYDFAKDPIGAGCPAVVLLGVGIAYNKNLVQTPPKSWKMLLQRDLPAMNGYMDIGYSVAPALLIHMSEFYGGGISNVQPGLKAIAASKDRLRFFTLFEVMDWINRGEVAVAPMLNNYVKIDPNVPLAFAFPEDGTLGVVNLACIVKGTQNKAAAERFINYYLSEEPQTKSVATWGETPVNKTVKLPEKLNHHVVTADKIQTMKFYDPVTIAKALPKWVEMFQEIVVAK